MDSVASESAGPKRKRRKSYATRTCRLCRDRRQRCEPPPDANLIPPSSDPVEPRRGCNRCQRLGQPCIFDDFSRATRVRLENKRRASNISPVTTSTAAPAPDLELERHSPSVGSGTRGEPIASETTTSIALKYPENVEEFRTYLPRRRPITIVSEMAASRSSFNSLWLNRPSNLGHVNLDNLVSDPACAQVTEWSQLHLRPWLPYLPDPLYARQQRRQRVAAGLAPAPHLQLIEAGIYLIAARHLDATWGASRAETLAFLTDIILCDLSLILICCPADLQVIHALELMTAFPPQLTRVDPGTIAASAKRALLSYCGSHSKQLTYPDPATPQELELTITAYNISAWDAACYFGVEDYFRSCKPQILLRQEKIEPFIQTCTRNDKGPLRHLPPSVPRSGAVAAALRALLFANLSSSWLELGSVEIEAPESERLNHLSDIASDWDDKMEALSSHAEVMLDPVKRPEQLALQWLKTETSSCHLIFTGRLFFQADRAPFTPQCVSNLIRGHGVSSEMQAFAFKHGDSRTDACETALACLARINEDAGAGTLVIPTLLACGYALEAAVHAMDVHATTLKFWHGMPRRSESWRLALVGTFKLLKRIDPTSIEEGSIAQSSAQILSGILDLLTKWKMASRKRKSRAKDNANTSQPSVAATANVDSNEGDGSTAEGSHHSIFTPSSDMSSSSAFLETPWEDWTEPFPSGVAPGSADELLFKLFGDSNWGNVLTGIDGQALAHPFTS